MEDFWKCPYVMLKAVSVVSVNYTQGLCDSGPVTFLNLFPLWQNGDNNGTYVIGMLAD